MIARTNEYVEGWTAPAAAAFEFWVSFFPAAPMFGVEWRFADLAGSFSPWTGPIAGKVKKPSAATPNGKPARKPGQAEARHSEAKEAIGKKAPAARAGNRQAAPKLVAVKSMTQSRPVPQVTAKAPAKADDLKLIKGIGAGLEKQLNALGIRNFAQIAALSDKELTALDDKLTTIKGRCFRDNWVGQAKTLAA